MKEISEKPIKTLARGRQSMYQNREKQVSLYENPICFAYGRATGSTEPMGQAVGNHSLGSGRRKIQPDF